MICLHGFGECGQAAVGFEFIVNDGQQGAAQQGQVADKVCVAAARGIFAPDCVAALVAAVLNASPVSPDESVPLRRRVFFRFVAADVIANRNGCFAGSLALEPDGEYDSCVRKAAFHGVGRGVGDRTLFDPSMFFICPSVPGFGSCEHFFDGFEQRALVAFYLKEAAASFFDDDASCFVLVVQGIGGEGFAVEHDDGVPDELAIHGQCAGKLTRTFAKPFGKHRGHFPGIDITQEGVEYLIAGDLAELLSPRFQRQPDLCALSLNNTIY